MPWTDFPEQPIVIDTPCRYLVRDGVRYPAIPAPSYDGGTRCTPDDPVRPACCSVRVFGAVGHAYQPHDSVYRTPGKRLPG